MDSIQEKAQREQTNEIMLNLKAAVAGLAPGSPERDATFKKALDGTLSAASKEKRQQVIWDFSHEKAAPVFAGDELVTLRPVKMEDADFYVGIRAQYSMMYQGILRLKKPVSEALLIVDLCRPECFYCMVEKANDNALIGYLGIKDASEDIWEIAIELDGQNTHKGFGSRSICLFLNELQRITGKAEYRALVEADNLPSQKCFEKLGANLTGLCNSPILKLDEEKKRFEDRHLDLIDDNMKVLAARLDVEPRKLLSHVLEYRLTSPL